MRKSRTPTCTPKLRFPEFRDATEWAQKVGEDLFLNRKEIGEDGLPIYSVTINDGMVPRASFDRDFYDIADSAGNKKVREGDIAYNMMRMWQGALGVAPTDCMVSPAYVVLAPKEGTCTAFFAQLFKLPQSLELLTATSRGLTKDRLRLYFDDFASMRLCAPEYDEQRRIAACLASLDELIGAESQKLDTLKAHKEGLMQQFFPREGEAIPRLRFPEFSDAWDESPLGALSASISSGRDEKVPDGPFDLYGSTGVIGKTSSETFVGTFLLVARVGANAGFLTKTSGSFGVTDNTLVIDLIDKKNSDFIYYYLGNLGLNKMIFGSGQPLITGGQLKALPVRVPCKSEREKISSCLSSLDELISAQSNKLAALRNHKKGLMQQLFPCPAESAG